jgi:hypothetical protein
LGYHASSNGSSRTIAEELKEFKFNSQPVHVTPKDFSANEQRDLQGILMQVMQQFRTKIEGKQNPEESDPSWN